MSEISTNRKRVMFESESTYGTDAVNALLDDDGSGDIVYQDVRTIDIDPTREIFAPTRQRSSVAGVAHRSFADLTGVGVELPMTGKAASGAGNEAPFYAALLKAAGFSETISSGASATYKPSTVAQAAMTAYAWYRNLEDANWRLEYATGIRGNLSMNFEMNAEPYMTFEGTGRYEELITDAAAFFGTDGAIDLLKDGSTAVTARTTGTETQVNKTIMGCKSMTVTVGGTTMPVSALELNINWTPDLIRTMNGAQTVSKVLLTKGDAARIEGSFDLQDGSTAMEAVRDALAADSEVALNIVLTDGTDTITITSSKLQIGFWNKGANGNVRTYSVPFFLNGDWSNLAGDNDLSIVFT